MALASGTRLGPYMIAAPIGAGGMGEVYRATDTNLGRQVAIKVLAAAFAADPERLGRFEREAKTLASLNHPNIAQIYVQPFPGPGGKFQISANGGAQPRWNKNGREVFYVSLDGKMMAAPVKLSPDGQSLETGTPAALFPVRIAGGPLPGSFKQQYAVSSDGQRFLVNLAADEGVSSPITLILNWKPRP
jgi:protein kinase-like protein